MVYKNTYANEIFGLNKSVFNYVISRIMVIEEYVEQGVAVVQFNFRASLFCHSASPGYQVGTLWEFRLTDSGLTWK